MQFKKVLSVFIGIILGLSICLLMIFINLPNIVESQAEKRLPQFLNSAEVDFHIQKLGLYNTFVSKLRFGKGLTIDFINIDYGINGLSSLNIDTITLSGLKIIASVDKNNQIKIQGLELPKSEKSKTFKIENPFLAWLPKKIILKNSKIILHKGSQEFVIPFDILSSLKLNDDKVVAQILFHPFGENISAKVTYDMNKGIEGVAIEGKSFDVGHINQMIPKNIDGFNVNDFVDFKLESSAPLKKWKIWVSNIDMEKPLKTTINDLNAMMLINQKKINVDGSFNLIHQPIPAVQMKYGLILDLEKDIFFNLNFSNDKMDDFKLTHESKSAKLKNLKILATFQGTPEKSNGKVDIKLDGGQIQYEKESLHFSNTQILTDISADFSEEGKGIGSKFNIISKNIQTKSNGINASFPLASISGQCQVDKKYTPKGFMTLNASKGKISSAKFKTHASDISVEIPVQYPTPKKERIGKYSIPSISYDKQYHLSAKGKIRQRKFLEFLVDGSASFKSLPEMEPIYNLVVGFKNGAYANVDFETNSFNVTHDDIQKLTPQNLQTAQIDITASAKGNAEFINHQLKTKMHVNVNNGNVHIPDMNFTASGINTAIALNDLLVAESIPGQILTIDSIEVNKIKIDDAKVRFSIEDAKSLLIENIQAKWCGGHVSTESIRLSMDKKDYALSLYCDRLEMAQLMEQMEILKSKGTGTLNGRLPISYSDGDISFNNGFLFSTSGSGGKIKIEDTSKIIASAGIPMNDPAFVQIDLAQEALKDFDYKWAKLIFNTFEDELTLNISINGKPTKNLPFEPLASGGFVRVDESSPGSVLEGLQLDVNLNLPFKEMMKFGNKLKSIFN